MRNFLPFRLLAALLLLFGLNKVVHAQVTEPVPFTVQVAGLTSDERDAVVRELAVTGLARLSFACVPAGLMVFEPLPNKSREGARSSATTILEARTQRHRIAEVSLSLSDAEAACAEARNR